MGRVCVDICLLKTENLVEPKVASHVYCTQADEGHHNAGDGTSQGQEGLRNVDWLAEAKRACVKDP